MTAATLWHQLVSLAEAKKIPDAASLSPEQLQWARAGRHAHGTTLPAAPASYHRLIDELGGYPMFGLGYYDREGFSFLPPSPMSVLSADVFSSDAKQPKITEGAPTQAFAALFAGYDLSDIEGWAFTPDGEVWEVERSMLSEPAGDFDSWAAELFTRSIERLSEADEEQLSEWRQAVADESDPHRLFDYSLETYPIPERSAADRALHWVRSHATSPCSYGLIDDHGDWRIPLGPRFRSVRPFTGGIAEVIFNRKGTTYAGPWTRIDLAGEVVRARPRS